MAKVLNIKEGVSMVPEIIDAIAKGYRDDIVLDEIAQVIEEKAITKQQFEGAVNALELYAARFTSSVKRISDTMQKFEFNDEQPVLKNRQLDLAQQVMRDVDGFNEAVDEFEDETLEIDGEKPEEEEVKEAVEKETLVEQQDKISYKDYFMKKLQEFKVTDPSNLTPEQWNEIDQGWQTGK